MFDLILQSLDPEMGAEKKYGFGGAILSEGRGREFSEGLGELNSQRGLDSRRLSSFSANVLFLWQHCY